MQDVAIIPSSAPTTAARLSLSEAAIPFLIYTSILVGIIVAIAACTQTVSFLFDRYASTEVAPIGSQREIGDFGAESIRSAGLTGITISEWRSIVEKILRCEDYYTAQIAVKKCKDPLESNNFCNITTHNHLNSPRSILKCSSETFSNGYIKESGGESSLGVPSEISEKTNNQTNEGGNNSAETMDLNYPDNCCSICMEEYDERCQIVIGDPCSHIFHKECLLAWLEKQNACPICRDLIISPDQIREVAQSVLGQERLSELTELNLNQSSANVELTQAGHGIQSQVNTDVGEMPHINQVESNTELQPSMHEVVQLENEAREQEQNV